jgi:hypothetical protein
MTLPPTNPYQEHKNMRPVREIGLTDRSTMEERERAYQGEEDQKSTRNQAFTEESSNRHGEDL